MAEPNHSQAPSVFVHGMAISTGWADARSSLTDLIFVGVSAGLADAGVSMAQIDSVVLSSHDLVDGRSLSSMVTAPAAGAYLRDEIRVTDDGLCAVSLAAARIEAGESHMAVVAAWGRASERQVQSVSHVGLDPFFLQPLMVDELSVSALRLSSWLRRNGENAEARSRAGAARMTRARGNSRCVQCSAIPLDMNFPLKSSEGPALADVVVAMILSSSPSSIRIAGIGHGTDVAPIGDRDLISMPALRDAGAIASRAAGICTDQFELYELDGATLSDEVLAFEALGIVSPGRGFHAYADDPRCNPSGGSAAAWSYPTNGLLRMTEAGLQLRRSDGVNQHPGKVRNALVTGLSPMAAQTAVAIALEKT